MDRGCWRGRLPLLLAAAAMVGAAPALAGNGVVPSRGAPAAPAPVEDGRPDPLCAGFGKGFTRLAGTSTCVKISGNVQADSYQQSLPGSPLAPALRSR